MATLAPSLNFRGVLSVSKRIVNAHSRHFLALSVLFLLPLSFSLIIFPTLLTVVSHSQPKNTRILLSYTRSSPTPEFSLQNLILPLLFNLFALIFSLCAAATITYSTYHGFFGRPVKLVAAMKSLLYSFVPLVATTIACGIVMGFVILGFGVFLLGVTKGVEILGFAVDYNSGIFMGFCSVVGVSLLMALIHLEVNWVLAGVVVVVESKWGFEALRRSKYLVEGKRQVSLALLLFFGITTWAVTWACSGSTYTQNFNFNNVWDSLGFVLRIVSGSSIVTILMLHNVASMTVLYMYCKALHGELALEIAEEFARDYVSLPFDEEKTPYVVYVAQSP